MSCLNYKLAREIKPYLRFMPDNILLLALIFIASLALLVFASGKFIEASEKLGLALGLPPFVIGVTVVALGTSLPEMVSSILAVQHGESEIVVGNIVGSNITNILLIIGTVAFLGKSIQIKFNFKRLDLPFLLGTTAFLFYAIWDLKIAFWEGVTFLGLTLLFVILSLSKGKDLGDEVTPKLTWQTVVILLLGGLGVYFGAKYNIASVIKIGDYFHISPAIIALTAVALGTSLPELFVSLAAVRKGKAEIAVGNVLGSNIYNVIAIGGISRMVGEISVPVEIKSTSILIMIGATLMFAFMLWNKKLTRWEGVILLASYVSFIAFSFLV
jgi:cation:H+ antiporter